MICEGQYMLALGGFMRALVAATCATMLLSGCASMPDETRNVLIGIGVGAGVGALIGSAVATGGGSIAAGAAIGGATGGVIGSLIKPNACYFTNRQGELWQNPCGHVPKGAVACFYGRAPGWLEEVDCRSRAPYRAA
jgi:hypothetical protein